jgi:hypothetical protein
MNDLTEFLLARIAEDERDFRESYDPDPWGFDRVLAECEAKRQIVEDWQERHALTAQYRTEQAAGQELGALTAMCRIAAIYADHPDYRQEWRA